MAGKADPRIDRYFAAREDRPFLGERLALRALCLSEGLDETLKWRAPCYMAHDRNVAMVAAVKDGAVLSFFSGVLLDDPDGLLSAPGTNSRSARWVKLSDISEVKRLEPALRSLLRNAVAAARQGRKVVFAADDLDLPDELAEALAAEPDFKAAWERLTPGRQRGYVLQISGAKLSATRAGRVAKHRARILAGLGLHDR